MKNSRSTGSASSALIALCAALLALVVAWPTGAHAGRKRVVVLEFDGVKAAQFQKDLEKLLKRKHSVVSLAKWNDTADDLGAGKITDANVKRIAAKMSVDGVIAGKSEKRGNRYFLHLTLRAGASGKVIGKADIVERNGGLGASGKADVDEQFMHLLDDLPALGSGDDEDEEEVEEEDEEPVARGKGKAKPRGGGKAKGKPVVEEEDEEEEEDEDDRRAGWGRGKSRVQDDDDEEEDEEEEEPVARGKGKTRGKAKAPPPPPPPKGKGKGKARPVVEEEDEEEIEIDEEEDEDDDRVAFRDEDEDFRDDDEDDEDLDRDDRRDRDRDDDDEAADDPRAAIDVAAGLSFTGRRLTFTTNLTANKPQGYKGAPVPGLRIAADAFPLAMNKANRSFTRNLGVQVLFDRALSISSTLLKDGMSYELPTVEQHLAFGVVYRHPFSAAFTLEGSLRFNKRKFVIDKSAAPMASDVDIPNTDYSYVDPGLGLHYQLDPKMALGADARFLLITSTGEMSQADQYGGATVTGLDLQAHFDYRVASKILVRAAAGFATIGFAFKGNGALTNNRDMDDSDTDVSGARDTYYGGSASAVYLF